MIQLGRQRWKFNDLRFSLAVLDELSSLLWFISYLIFGEIFSTTVQVVVLTLTNPLNCWCRVLSFVVHSSLLTRQVFEFIISIHWTHLAVEQKAVSRRTLKSWKVRKLWGFIRLPMPRWRKRKAESKYFNKQPSSEHDWTLRSVKIFSETKFRTKGL